MINFNNYCECVGGYKVLNEFTERLLLCVEDDCTISEIEVILTRQQLAKEILTQGKEFLNKFVEESEEFNNEN